ncbi:hypothetical protein ACS0TY_019775 [Phlomoides rotata]
MLLIYFLLFRQRRLLFSDEYTVPYLQSTKLQEVSDSGKGYRTASFNRSGYTVSKHFNLVLNTLLKLYNVLLVTPEPIPEDSNDYRWDYFKYVCLKNILGISGVGLNSTTYHVDALPEVWESQIKVDVFGNDRATGQDSQLYTDVDESSPATEKNASECPSFSVDGTSTAAQANKKEVKRKQSDGAEMQFMDTVGNYCDASKSTFGQIAETMSHIEKHVGSEYDNRQRREKVYDGLSLIEFILVEAKVAIAQYLSNNTKDMDLFIGLPDEVKTVFLTNIMRKLASG